MDFDETSVSSNKSDKAPNTNQDDLFFLEKDPTIQQIYPTKECVLFLVDCASSMHKIYDDEGKKTTPLTTVLKVSEEFLKTKIISNEKDSFGIILFNTFEKNNEMNFDGVNVLFNLSQPNATQIKKIKDLTKNCDPEINKNDYQKELEKIFKSNSDNKNYLNNGLWLSHSILKNFDKKNFKRRIFLFTDNDDPIKDDLQEKNVCLQRAKDMNDSDILIEIFPMNFHEKFNLGKFFAFIIPTNSDDDINPSIDNLLSIEQSVYKIKELTKRIRQKEIKKRTLSKCPFYICNNEKIYLNIYSSIKKSSKGRVFNIDAKTNKILKNADSHRCKDSGAILYPEQIGTYQLYGNKKVIFSKDEMKKIKLLQQPGITLLGFKNIENIKPYYNIRESYFVYPNEIFSEGSGKLIDALIKQMSNKKKCAIVKFLSREGSSLKICALIPQLEKYDEDYFQTPPGFNMIVLPWADEIMSNSDILSKNPKKLPKVNEKIADLAKNIIKKMNISFDCREFENYDLQKFYSTLQALALDETNIEKVEDTIQPHDEGLIKVLNGLDEKFNLLVFGEKERNEDQFKDKKNINKNNNRSNGNKKTKEETGKRRKLDINDEISEDSVNYCNNKKKNGSKKKQDAKKENNTNKKSNKKKEDEMSEEESSDNEKKKSSKKDEKNKKSKKNDMSMSDDSDSENRENNKKKSNKKDEKSKKSKKNDMSMSDDSGSESSESNKKKNKKKDEKHKKHKKSKKNNMSDDSESSDSSSNGSDNSSSESNSKSSSSESSSESSSDSKSEGDKRTDYSDENLEKLIKTRKIEKMEIDEIKSICKKKKINTKGLKKKDIIKALKKYLAD